MGLRDTPSLIRRRPQRSQIQVSLLATLSSPVLSLFTSQDRVGRQGVRAYPVDERGQETYSLSQIITAWTSVSECFNTLVPQVDYR
jgi:hypothetical protein